MKPGKGSISQTKWPGVWGSDVNREQRSSRTLSVQGYGDQDTVRRGPCRIHAAEKSDRGGLSATAVQPSTFSAASILDWF